MSIYTARAEISDQKLLMAYPHMAMAAMLLSAKPGTPDNRNFWGQN